MCRTIVVLSFVCFFVIVESSSVDAGCRLSRVKRYLTKIMKQSGFRCPSRMVRLSYRIAKEHPEWVCSTLRSNVTVRLASGAAVICRAGRMKLYRRYKKKLSKSMCIGRARFSGWPRVLFFAKPNCKGMPAEKIRETTSQLTVNARSLMVLKGSITVFQKAKYGGKRRILRGGHPNLRGWMKKIRSLALGRHRRKKGPVALLYEFPKFKGRVIRVYHTRSKLPHKISSIRLLHGSLSICFRFTYSGVSFCRPVTSSARHLPKLKRRKIIEIRVRRF